MKKSYKVCTLPGDGIGPEVIALAEGVKVLDRRGGDVPASTFDLRRTRSSAALRSTTCGDPLARRPRWPRPGRPTRCCWRAVGGP